MTAQFLPLTRSRQIQEYVMFRKRTAKNFFTLFATSAANFFLVIGRRFMVKSVVGI